jgi:NAD(P)-dependent dehydrogenase (short-subunit alcohol dehydrogenase family)
MSDRLRGRTAVITAAGSGMGRESAVLFARQGAEVILMDIDREAAHRVADEIREDGGSATPVVLDLTNANQLQDAFAEMGHSYEKLDVLFNHAGRPGAYGLDFSEADWEATLALNLTTPVMATRYALPLLRRAARGTASIIFTSSVSGLVASPASPIYSATKGGVVLFMKAIAVALGPEGIRANAICPGPTETPMLREFMAPPGTSAEHATTEEIQSMIAKYAKRFIPLQRLAAPADIASTALFLASDESAYVTGVALPVDGGFVAR